MASTHLQLGWREAKLGDIAEIVKDAWKPSDEQQSYIGLEHINEQDLTLNGVGRSDGLESNKFRFKAGDILFGKLRPYFRKVVVPSFDGVCSTDIWVIRAKQDNDQKFLFYFMANPVLIDKSMGASTGSRMPRADWNFLSETRWSVPEQTEQRAIAAVLSSLDDKIKLLRSQNKTLESITQQLFHEWFVEFNFPNPDDKPYKRSGGNMVEGELGEMPEGWKTSGLSEIADFLNGLALQKFPPESPSSYLPVIKIREMKAGISDQTDKASANLNEKYVVHDGDILFSWSGSLEVVLWKYGKGALNQHLFKVTSQNYPKWFYYHWLMRHLEFFRMIASVKATTMGHIQRYHLDEAKVIIPTETVMKKADTVFAPLFDKMIANNAHISSLTLAREALLPPMMSGEVRVQNNS